MNYLIGFIFSILLMSCVKDKPGERISIQYIPFDEETFIAITPYNIKNHCELCVEKWVPISEMQEIRGIFSSDNIGNFDEKKVRLKIGFYDGSAVFVDSAGGALISKDNKSIFLNKNEFTKLKRIIISIQKTP